MSSRNGSTSSASSSGSRRSSSAGAFFKGIGHKIAEHHRDVNAAYEHYYAQGYHGRGQAAASRSASVAEPAPAAPRESVDSVRDEKTAASAAVVRESTWQRVKRHAKQHHEGVQGAHEAVYGHGA